MVRTLKLSAQKVRVKMQFIKFLQYFAREFEEGKDLFTKLESKRYFNEQYFRMIFLKSMDILRNYTIKIESPYPSNSGKIDILIEEGSKKSAIEIKYLRPNGSKSDGRWLFLGDIYRLARYCKPDWNRYLFLILDKRSNDDFKQNIGLIYNSQFTQNLNIVYTVKDGIVLELGQNRKFKLGRNNKFKWIKTQSVEIQTLQSDWFDKANPRYFFYLLKINPL